jgi:hypothetical protein
LENVLAPMQVPFPELTDLRLSTFYSWDATPPAIPDSFLGGSAPRLRHFSLHGIRFPGLPNLLLTATHLIELRLTIPDSGYISPKAMAALLSALSSLRILSLEYRFRQSGTASGWESQTSPLPKRSILPTLDNFFFKGATEYFEDLVTRIDTPQLDRMHITLFSQIGTPRLAQFINRTSLTAGDKARVEFHHLRATVELPARVGNLHIMICTKPDQQLSSVAQVCNPLHSLSTVEGLCIGDRNSWLVWKDDAVENTLWLQVLLPFPAVKNLYLSKVFAPGIAAALKELVGHRILEVLPSLQNIFVEGLEPSGPLQEMIGQFVASRQLSDHPIAVSDWDRE